MSNINLKEIISRVYNLPAELAPFKEMLLANVVMISEIPAPTFKEQKRISFLEQRFNECGLMDCCTDEVGNALAFLPGTENRQTILLTAHADVPFAASVDHNCTVDDGKVHGPGVADNSLGLAILATLPTILKRLDIRLKSKLLFLSAIRSLNRGNQCGIRFFLTNSRQPVVAAIAIEGIPLGRLHYRSMASIGGMISCHIDRRVNHKSAIEILNRIINQLALLPLPAESHTDFTLGSISGGTSYKIPALHAQLQFQLRSDDDRVVKDVAARINSILEKIGRELGVTAHLENIAQTRSGGLDSSHPFVIQTRRIMTALGIQPQKSIYSPIITGYVEQEIPAIALGLTRGDNIHYPDEFIEIEPVLTGIAQLIGTLMALDGGCCD
jgi:acetylornithine deacetylase/succinyl-diaminopimelate desuccinylase-like protein